MIRSIFLIIIFAYPLCAAHESIEKENFLYLSEHIFKEVGGYKTYILMLKIGERAKKDKDIDLIFKAARIDKEKALTALKCYTVALELINAGIKRTTAIRITMEAKKDEENIDSALSVLAYALKKEGALVDSAQVAEALRQAELLLHLELNPKIAFEENGIDIDSIDLVQREVERLRARGETVGLSKKNLKEEDLLPKRKLKRQGLGILGALIAITLNDGG